jgi:hypothetical protein
MKIFTNGKYTVVITKISYGISEIKKFPYFLCRFQFDDRYIEQRFYQSEKSKFIIEKLFEAAGINDNNFVPDRLIGKYINIEVTSGYKINKNNIPFSFGEAKKFWKCDEVISAYENYSTENVYDDEDINDIGWTSFIFGVDIEDVAEDMGIHLSQVNENDIREYCGY